MVRIPVDRSLLVTLPCAVAATYLLQRLPTDAAREKPVVAIAVGLAILVSEAFPLHFAVRGERHTSTFIELPIVAGLVLSPGRYLVGAVVGALVVAQLARRLPLRKAGFNVAQYGLASAVALSVVQVGGVGSVMLAALAFVAVNEVAVQLVLKLVAGQPFGLPYQGRAALWALHLSVSISGGVLIGTALQQRPELVVALVAPLVFLAIGQRESLRRTLSEELHRSIAVHALEDRPADPVWTLRLVATLAKETLAGERAEVLLLDGPRPLLCSDGPDGVEVLRLPELWLDRRDWFTGCLAGGTDGEVERRRASMVVGGPDGALALVAVFRGEEQEAYRPPDLEVLATLCRTSSYWLRQLDLSGRDTVLDLGLRPVEHESLSRPRLLQLVRELDLVIAQFGNEAAAQVPALGEMQELLTSSLSEALEPPTEASVSVGSWVDPVMVTP